MTEFHQIMADTPPVQVSQRPEWLRVDDAIKLFGISRSKLYELIGSERIKAFCLRERGKIRGRRLISYESLHAFMEAQAKLQQQQEPGGESTNG
jgi:excisionase family DNA binding protein